MSDKNAKEKFVDDGRTIVSMDFEQYQTFKHPTKKPVQYYRDRQHQLGDLEITRKERWAMIKAIYSFVIPFALALFGVLALAMFLLLKYWNR